MINIIACFSMPTMVIGDQNTIPWHLPEDMKRFKELTTGKTVIMGRKTWDSLPDRFKPLPNRVNIILTRNKDFEAPEGVIVRDNLEDAVAYDEDVFVIGGEKVYAEALEKNLADRMYLTGIKQAIPGDAFFPVFDKDKWTIKEESWLKHKELDYCFREYVK